LLNTLTVTLTFRDCVTFRVTVTALVKLALKLNAESHSMTNTISNC